MRREVIESSTDRDNATGKVTGEEECQLRYKD
jgi:hypothetical protein